MSDETQTPEETGIPQEGTPTPNEEDTLPENQL